MADKSDGKSKMPVFIGKVSAVRPFDAEVGKAAARAAQAALAKAFNRAKGFEVVSSEPRDRGIVVVGNLEGLEHDTKSGNLKGRLAVQLGAKPGTNTFGQFAEGDEVAVERADRIAKAAESLGTMLGLSAGDRAVGLAERQAKR